MANFVCKVVFSFVALLTFCSSYACTVLGSECILRERTQEIQISQIGLPQLPPLPQLPKLPGVPGIDPECRGDICRGAQGISRETDRALSNVARELGKTPQAIQECLGNVNQCVNEVLSAPLALGVQAYLDGLYRQSEGRTHNFSREFISLAQPYYEINLNGVTFADGIDTGHRMTVAYCDRIFFSTNGGNLWQDKSHLHLVLHELEHLVQCQKRGKRTFLAEYILKGASEIIQRRRIDIHDHHDFEASAEAKANSIVDQIWNKIQSGSVAIPSMPNPSTSTPIGASSQTIMPNPGPIIPVRFCRTPMGTCEILPTMVPMGSVCYCVANGQMFYGSAF